MKNFSRFIKESYEKTYVYRGSSYDTKSPRKSIWVTYNIEFAKEYGNVKKYELSNNLNILDTYNYSEWETLIDNFYGDDIEYDEVKYEPSDDFISYLISLGYDGFENGDNLLIFDKDNLMYVI